jgi:signal transduction histidine kinase
VSRVRSWAAGVGALVRHPLQVDRIVAAAGFAGAWWNAAREPHKDLGAVAVVALAVLMGTIAWRRSNPVASTIVAAAALAGFQAVSLYNGDGTFEAAAIAFNFYILGQYTRSRLRALWCTACFTVWLGTAWVITFDPGPGSIGSMAGTWVLFGPLPFACGFLLASRSLLTENLRQRSALIDREQERRSRGAAAEERSRMARELHDVIAHCLSVMVVQASGARTVATLDPEQAGAALRVVESAGREALGDLRRLVGSLRRGGEPGGASGPGLGDVETLAGRARAAGLDVGVHLSGPVASLDPAVAAVAYRVVQEALTNCIKHAGPARADVSARIGEAHLDIAIVDTGCGRAGLANATPGSGQGLIGMGERVSSLGGELRAGPRAEGGFEVRARIPLQRATVPEGPAAGAGVTHSPAIGGGSRLGWRDPVCAGALLVTLEIAILTSNDVRGPLALNALAVSGFAIAALWRRRYPLMFVMAVAAIAAVMSVALTPLRDSAIITAFWLLVPPYSVASWASRFRAVLGLGLVLGLGVIDHLASHAGTPADLAGGAVIATAAWGLGRAVQARRTMNTGLGSTLARQTAESDHRTKLAVAGERSRIARELHESLAGSISVMVVQAEAAAAQLTQDPASAHQAMEAIEHTGRQSLADMRRILGTLRRGEDTPSLQPLPGVDQVYALIKEARDADRPVELRVEGEPGDIPATVELGVYRVLEEALRDTRAGGGGGVTAWLLFRDDDLELRLTARRAGPNRWPTGTMRERIALCGGTIDEAGPAEDGWHLAVRMPRAAEGALL